MPGSSVTMTQEHAERKATSPNFIRMAALLRRRPYPLVEEVTREGDSPAQSGTARPW